MYRIFDIHTCRMEHDGQVRAGRATDSNQSRKCGESDISELKTCHVFRRFLEVLSLFSRAKQTTDFTENTDVLKCG